MLARALAQQTPLLLLDEPTAHLDLSAQAEVLSLLQEQSKQQQCIVMVLHDLNLAALYASHICILLNKEIRVVGTAEQVFGESTLSAAYGDCLHRLTHPLYGVPAVLPKRKDPIYQYPIR